MTAINTDLYLGDCLEVLADFDIDSFDLIVTSPPYANRRSKTYGGISPDEYVNRRDYILKSKLRWRGTGNPPTNDL